MKTILTFTVLIMISNLSQGQNWIDSGLYPFEHQSIQLESGKMHYVDEGEGEILLFVHGTPTWSFLYRDFIKSFSSTHRCIAIDHIGFGLSEKPESFDGTPQSHSKNLIEFIDRLKLDNITLIVHDFGGPIGLSAAIENHNKIKRVIMFNTWLWETKNNPGAAKIDKILNSKMGQFLYLRMNFSPKVLLKKGFHNPKKLTKAIHKHYINPFPTKVSRYSLLRIGQSLVKSSDWYQEQWEKLHLLDNKPWLILWGTEDQFINTEYLETWEKRLPQALVKKLECGHFVQEEKTMESIKQIKRFIGQN